MTDVNEGNERPINGFQLECRKRAAELLAQLGAQLEEERKNGKRETYITARVSGTDLVLWIYDDETEISGPGVDDRFESPDYDTSEELISAFTEALVQRVKAAMGARERGE